MNLAAFLLIGGFAALLIYGWLRSRRIRFNSLSLGSGCEAGSGSPQPLNILHLSDIHGSRASGQQLSVIEALSEKEWDFIFITGDLIEDDTGIEPVSAVLGRLKARYGKFAVLGNHDYFRFEPRNIIEWFRVVLGGALNRLLQDGCRVPNDIDRLRDFMERAGVRVLRNELIEGVTEQGCSYQIFGIDDPVTEKDNPEALYSRKNSEALRLVLIHSPERLERLCPLEPEMVLCGHTHGGQIRLPFLGALSTGSDAKRNAASGLVRLGGCRVYISAGIGTGHTFPYRFNSPPEITRLIIPQPIALSGSPGNEPE